MGLGLPSDNNFQPITSFVSIAMLGNEIVVGVLGYGLKRDLSLRIIIIIMNISSPVSNTRCHSIGHKK